MTRDPRLADTGNARPPSAWSRALLLAAACMLLLVAALASLWMGSRGLPAAAVWHALARPDDGLETLVVASRIPRTLLALLTGAALAVAGALMQALTRNPLAEPGLLGVNAGAAASIVSAALLMGGMPAHPFWAALPGARTCRSSPSIGRSAATTSAGATATTAAPAPNWILPNA